MNAFTRSALTGVALLLTASAALAQAPQYGPIVTLEQARKAVAAAEAEARKNNWPVAVAVVDTAGTLVAYEMLDGTQTASARIAEQKAVSAAIYRRPTKVFQDVLAKGGDGWRVLHLDRAIAVDGGLPIVSGGKIIGAIGVSGVAPHEDAVAAKAGADALK